MNQSPLIRRAAFTLVELLVVIGIITLLMSILLPTIARIRDSAREADTRQQLTALSQAIDHYAQLYGAYPGPFPNDKIGPGQAAPVIVNPDASTVSLTNDADSSPIANVSSSENLILGLVGGLYLTVDPTTKLVTKFGFNDSYVRSSKGPANLNVYNYKFLDNSWEANKDLTSPGLWGKGPQQDTAIPELMDRFANQVPIIYMRATRDAKGIISADGTAQYNSNHYLQYGMSFPTADYASDTAYFTNPNRPGAARNENGYLLISAGRDGKFGTKDDIIIP